MSNELFGRKYSLIIGRPQATSERNEINASTKNFKTKQLTQAGVRSKVYDTAKFIEISDLDLRGTIKYSRTTNPKDKPDSSLILRGLSKATRNFIQQGDIVIFSAGYEQDAQLPLILSGEIVSKEDQSPLAGDEVTLVISQSFTALRNIRVSRSWPPSDATLYRVIKDLTDLLVTAGVDYGSSQIIEKAKDLLESVKFVGGYSVEGNIFAVLEKLLATYGLRAYFANDVLYIEVKSIPELRDVYTLQENSLKEPPRISQKVTKKKAKQNIQTGYVFTVFLDGKIKLNGKIRVPVGDYSGDYLITAIEHKLDYEGAAWHTKILCQREEV